MRSASSNPSLLPLVVVMAMHLKFPFLAACTPKLESSQTITSSGFTLSFFTAFKKISGSG